MSVPTPFSPHRRAARVWLIAAALSVAGSVLAAPPTGLRLAVLPQPASAPSGTDFAITGVELIDGSGAAPQSAMTVIVRSGRIEHVGPSAATELPADVERLDGVGRTLVPGFVMVHEHLFYPDGKGGYLAQPDLLATLYLAGGATTIRTAGGIEPEADLRVARSIAAGERLGPDIDVSGPFLDGATPSVPTMQAVSDAAAARQLIDVWAARGSASLKVYERIAPEMLTTVIEQAHARRMKVTGHLCSVSYAEAAKLGIDNIEHGFTQASDFVVGRTAGSCPDLDTRLAALAAVDPQGPELGELIDTLVQRRVALTTTFGVFETMTAGADLPDPAALALLSPPLRKFFDAVVGPVRGSPLGTRLAELAPRHAAMLRRFEAAGGLLLSGSDPTGFGGVLPGYSARREYALLVAAGFSPPQAIRIMSANGARYLDRADIGLLAAGRRADMVLLDGRLSQHADAMPRIDTVFKAGRAIDSAATLSALRGRVGE
jgi:imidazolonepropionase-like amidohydrolase